MTLNNIQHQSGEDIDILLVSPTGQKFIVLSDVGGGLGFIVPATVTLTDAALVGLPTTNTEVLTGAYRPTNLGAGDGFPAPAPTLPYQEPAPASTATFASTFAGFDPNGTWSLYVFDDSTGFSGRVQGGWCLRITTESTLSPGQVQFGTANYSGREGETANLIVTRAGGTQGAVTVNYATAAGSATGGTSCGSGADFIQQSGTLTFPDGVASQTVSIPLCLDADVDPDETFTVAISNPGGGADFGNDHDRQRSHHSGGPDAAGLFRYARFRSGRPKDDCRGDAFSNQIGTATVNYTITNGTAVGGAACTEGVDFIQQNGTLTFQPNDVTRSIQIATCRDNVREEIETATLTLSNPVGARLGSTTTATLNIYESDWRKQASFPTGQTLSELHMISALEGWAVGSYGVIIHTRDGGVTWERQTSGTFEQLNAVFFLDAQRGWASGNVDLYTTDGGANWQQGARTQPFGTIRQVYFIDANRGFEVGDGGRSIKRTLDGGRNWFVQEMPYRIGLIKFVDGQNGLASSLDGILVTDDGGDTWTPRPNATAADEWFDLLRGWRTVNRTIVGGLIQQKIEYTTDGGVSLDLGTVPSGTFVQRFFFLDPLNGWAVGTNENVIRTTDGGHTWQTLRGGINSPVAQSRPFEDIFMSDVNRGVAVGNTGLIYTTSDGGGSWIARQTGSGERVHKIVATDASHAWAAMEGGEILRQRTAATIGSVASFTVEARRPTRPLPESRFPASRLAGPVSAVASAAATRPVDF